MSGLCETNTERLALHADVLAERFGARPSRPRRRLGPCLSVRDPGHGGTPPRRDTR